MLTVAIIVAAVCGCALGYWRGHRAGWCAGMDEAERIITAELDAYQEETQSTHGATVS